jgi:hypothetical protein
MPEIEFKKTKQMIEDMCQDQYNREILRFFARHPYTHFDKQVLTDGLGLNDTRRIKTALEYLTKQQLLEIKSGRGAPLYWLTRCEPAQSAIRSFFPSKVRQTGDVADRLSMMQLSMPLIPCHV